MTYNTLNSKEKKKVKEAATIEACSNRIYNGTSLPLDLNGKRVSGRKIIKAVIAFVENHNNTGNSPMLYVVLNESGEKDNISKIESSCKTAEVGISAEHYQYDICVTIGNHGLNKVCQLSRYTRVNIKECGWSYPEQKNYTGNGRTKAMNEIKSGLEKILNK